MKRLAIYFFYNKDGVVGDYVPYYLNELKKFCDETCVVVNAPLSAEGRDILEKSCNRLLVRANEGFDSWAYKYAIESYGYDNIKCFDELILSNFTCYGPVYPFSELFSTMDSRKCDFWGINRHPAQPIYLTENKDSLINEHLQSYFLVFRSPILNDKSFKEYWDTLKPVRNYNEAIAHHEVRCTKFFEERGFISSEYMDFEKYRAIIVGNASILCAERQLMEDRNPLLKRKVFFLDNKMWLSNSLGHTASDCLDFIANHCTYDVGLIWRDLLKTQKMSVLRNNLHLNYFLSKSSSSTLTKNRNIALVIFTYYEDQVDFCCRYIRSMPSGSDIYVISSKEALLTAYKKVKDINEKYSIEYRSVQNQGRDVAAYLIGASDVPNKYDYICYVHDKKSPSLGTNLMGQEFAYSCFENNLASENYVNNVISTFENNPFLGMLVPPTVNFAHYYHNLGNELANNEKHLRELHKRLNLSVPFDECPVAPFGTMFWVRSKAFKSIFRHRWTYSDFPTEPASPDGTVMHAVERIYPMCVQEDGYYTGWLATNKFASCYLDNNTFMLRELNKILAQKLGYSDFSSTLYELENFNGKVGYRRQLYLLLLKIHHSFFPSFNPVGLKNLVKRLLLS